RSRHYASRTPTLFPYTTLFRSHRERGQVERAHELLIRRELREARVVVSRYGVDRLVEPRLGRRPLRRPLCLGRGQDAAREQERPDRKSTRLNSSHLVISYAVFC